MRSWGIGLGLLAGILFFLPIFLLKCISIILIGRLLQDWQQYFSLKTAQKLLARILHIVIINSYNLVFILLPYAYVKGYFIIRLPALLVIAVLLIYLTTGQAIFNTQNLSAQTTGLFLNYTGQWLQCTGFFAAVGLLLLPPAVLPYRGDMDYHISATLTLARYLFAPEIALTLILLLLLSIGYVINGKKILVYLLLVVSFLGAGFYYQLRGFDSAVGYVMLRYPPLIYYEILFTALHLGIAFDTGSLYTELLYVFPILLCWSGLAALIVVFFAKGTPLLFRFSLSGLFIISMPAVQKYQSLVYPEPPALLLLTVALFLIQSHHFKEYIPFFSAVWALIPYQKEMILPAVLVLSIWLLIKCTNIKRLLMLLTVVWLPLVLYLVFRIESGFRTGEMRFSNILVWANYQINLFSLAEQMSFSLVPAIVGLVFKPIKIIGLIGLWIGCYWLLFSCDVQEAADRLLGIGAYVGYSRFNLWLLPVLLPAAASLPYQRLYQKFKIMIYLPITVMILTNFYFLSPFNKYHWGDWSVKTGEYVYPYPQFYQWLQTRQQQSCLIVGRMDPYWDYFYCKKYRLSPDSILSVRNGSISNDSLRKLSTRFSWILYHDEIPGLYPSFDTTFFDGRQPLYTWQSGITRLAVFKVN